jgi:hypothetical protein
VNACDVFVYTENLQPEETIARRSRPVREKSKTTEPAPPDPTPLLHEAFDLAAQEDGWAFLGTLGHHIRILDPGFDSRTYGYRQLSQLIRAMPKYFDVKDVKLPDGNIVLYVKFKETK